MCIVVNLVIYSSGPFVFLVGVLQNPESSIYRQLHTVDAGI